MTRWICGLAEAGYVEGLLENPWPVVVVLVGASAVLRVMGKRRGQRAGVGAAWGALGLGLGVYAAASAVETDREAILAGTRGFVDAAAAADEAALAGLLAERAALVGPGGGFWDNLTPGFVAGEMTEHRVTDVAVRAVDAAMDRRTGAGGAAGRGFDRGVSTLSLRSRVSGVPTPTTWELSWGRGEDGGWRITEARWLTIGLRDDAPSPTLYR
ncbi:MAG: hypothetical protein AAGG38_06740 [Planctomycetota bacterium]